MVLKSKGPKLFSKIMNLLPNLPHLDHLFCRMSQESFLLLNKNNSTHIYPTKLVYISLESMSLLSWIKIFENCNPTLSRGTNKYKTQNQVQIFCMINALRILK